MEFDKGKMDFRQADRAFEELSRRRTRGEIGAEEFDVERKRLMVLDDQGRWWAKSGETGDWNYHDGRAWVAGIPPGYEPGAGETVSSAAVSSEKSTSATGASGPARRDSAGRAGRGSARRWPVAVVGMLVIVSIAGGLFFFLTRGSGDTAANSGGGVEVPDLVGADSLDAAREEAGGDFDVVEAGKVESKEPIGSIVEQERAAGETLEAGAEIPVKVSKGVEVIEVIGNDRDAAVELLEGRLFEVSTETATSPGYRKGKVISMSPKGGTFAEVGTPVVLKIGDGSEEASADAKPVPDVVGDTVEDAKEALADAGFDYEVEVVESDESAGEVVSTDPEAGTEVEPGSEKIAIKESSGPSADGGGSVAGGGSGSSSAGGAAGDQYTPPDTYVPPDPDRSEGWEGD